MEILWMENDGIFLYSIWDIFIFAYLYAITETMWHRN